MRICIYRRASISRDTHIHKLNKNKKAKQEKWARDTRDINQTFIGCLNRALAAQSYTDGGCATRDSFHRTKSRIHAIYSPRARKLTNHNCQTLLLNRVAKTKKNENRSKGTRSGSVCAVHTRKLNMCVCVCIIESSRGGQRNRSIYIYIHIYSLTHVCSAERGCGSGKSTYITEGECICISTGICVVAFH